MNRRRYTQLITHTAHLSYAAYPLPTNSSSHHTKVSRTQLIQCN
uniref:Uncharacterized protein n=1 Tax=Anguilla anguilla TaxID=7936 RepID=A0A0E9RRY5_ANGAN